MQFRKVITRHKYLLHMDSKVRSFHIHLFVSCRFHGVKKTKFCLISSIEDKFFILLSCRKCVYLKHKSAMQLKTVTVFSAQK